MIFTEKQKVIQIDVYSDLNSNREKKIQATSSFPGFPFSIQLGEPWVIACKRNTWKSPLTFIRQRWTRNKGMFLTQGSNSCLLHHLHWQAGSLPLVPPGKPKHMRPESTNQAHIHSFTYLSMVTFWRRQWHPTPVPLPGKSHGRRSLVGRSPWGCEESDTTEWLHFRFSLSCTGEGNGNPLQCSCLENPRDGGAWWAAVYGVAQSDMTEAT